MTTFCLRAALTQRERLRRVANWKTLGKKFRLSVEEKAMNYREKQAAQRAIAELEKIANNPGNSLEEIKQQISALAKAMARIEKSCLQMQESIEDVPGQITQAIQRAIGR